MVFALRIAYTQYKRHQSAKIDHPIACNAMVSNNGETTMAVSKLLGPTSEKDNHHDMPWSSEELPPPSYEVVSDKKAAVTASTTVRELSDNSSVTSSTDSTPPSLHRARPLANPIALLPQYLTPAPTTLTISEATFPHLGSNFTVTSSTGPTTTTPILRIHRERPSYTHRQTISDGATDTELLQIRRQRGAIPMSHTISDPRETTIAEIQGQFKGPVAGARIKAVFTNACDGTKTTLAIEGGWKNRRAEVRDVATGDVLAEMCSDWFTAKNVLASRRDYEVTVAAGVDVVMVVALIMALDARV